MDSNVISERKKKYFYRRFIYVYVIEIWVR